MKTLESQLPQNLPGHQLLEPKTRSTCELIHCAVSSTGQNLVKEKLIEIMSIKMTCTQG